MCLILSYSCFLVYTVLLLPNPSFSSPIFLTLSSPLLFLSSLPCAPFRNPPLHASMLSPLSTQLPLVFPHFLSPFLSHIPPLHMSPILRSFTLHTYPRFPSFFFPLTTNFPIILPSLYPFPHLSSLYIHPFSSPILIPLQYTLPITPLHYLYTLNIPYLPNLIPI